MKGIIKTGAAIGILSGLLCACSGGSGAPQPSSATPQIHNEANLPSVIVKGKTAIQTSVISLPSEEEASSAGKAHLLDSSAPVAIKDVKFPNVAGVVFKTLVSKVKSCYDGSGYAVLTPGTSCNLQFSVTDQNLSHSERDATAIIDVDVKVETSAGQLKIPVKVKFVSEGDPVLPTIKINSTPKIAPGGETAVTVTNTGSQAVNNLQLILAPWLAKLATDTNIQNDMENLASGASHTFHFSLANSQSVVDAIRSHYYELLSNFENGNVISVTAANNRADLWVRLNVALAPAETNTREVTFFRPGQAQTVTLKNLSTAKLVVGAVNTAKLPNGVNIIKNDCNEKRVLLPDQACAIDLEAEQEGRGSGKLVLPYSDTKGNSFLAEVGVAVAGVQLEASQEVVFSQPSSSSVRYPFTVKNISSFNWYPSTAAKDYQVTTNSGKLAEDVAVVNAPSGKNCLLGGPIAPGASCNIGVSVDNKAAVGNYLLGFQPVNNLTTEFSTGFSVSTPSSASLTASVDSSSGYNTVAVKRIRVANTGDAVLSFSIDFDNPYQAFTLYNSSNGYIPNVGDWCNSIMCPDACNKDTLEQGEVCYLYFYANNKITPDKNGSGQNISHLTLKSNSQVFEFELKNTSEIYIGGNDPNLSQAINHLYTSIDGGRTWEQSATIGQLGGVSALEIGPRGTIFVGSAYYPYIYESKNNGGSWIKKQSPRPADNQDQSLPTPLLIEGLSLDSKGNLYAVGWASRYIYKSSDEGDSWRVLNPQHPVPTSGYEYLYNLKFDTSNNILVGADDAAVFSGSLNELQGWQGLGKLNVTANYVTALAWKTPAKAILYAGVGMYANITDRQGAVTMLDVNQKGAGWMPLPTTDLPLGGVFGLAVDGAGRLYAIGGYGKSAEDAKKVYVLAEGSNQWGTLLTPISAPIQLDAIAIGNVLTIQNGS